MSKNLNNYSENSVDISIEDMTKVFNILLDSLKEEDLSTLSTDEKTSFMYQTLFTGGIYYLASVLGLNLSFSDSSDESLLKNYINNFRNISD